LNKKKLDNVLSTESMLEFDSLFWLLS